MIMTDELDLAPSRRALHWAPELIERGMDTARAEMLAGMDNVDLHAVVAALDAGCAPDTVWEIFS